MARLTPRQARFVDEYLVDQNAAAAAVRAGYSPKNGKRIGYQLLHQTPAVAKAVHEARADLATRAGIAREQIVLELAKIGFANMLDYMRIGPQGDPYLDYSSLTRDQAAALAEVTVEDFKDGRGEEARAVRRVKFKMHDKKGALVDLAKLLGYAVSRPQSTGNVVALYPAVTTVDLSDLSPEERDALRAILERRSGLAGCDDQFGP